MRWLVSMVIGGLLLTGAWVGLSEPQQVNVTAARSPQKKPQQPKTLVVDARSQSKPQRADRTTARSADKKPQQAATGRVDLNTATPQQLQALKGIGPAKAKAIVQHRQQRGAFTRITQLLEVKGIGSKLLKQLQSQVMISGAKQSRRCPAQSGLCQQH